MHKQQEMEQNQSTITRNTMFFSAPNLKILYDW